MADVGDGADLALEVGLNVRGEPEIARLGPRDDFGIPPAGSVTRFVSARLKGNNCRMAARPAMDSLTPCMSGASCEPVKSHRPMWRGWASMRERTWFNSSGTFWISSKI